MTKEEFMDQSTNYASKAALLTKALQLQHTRCETYQLWDTKFHRVLSGALHVGEFQASLARSVVSVFQEVSLSLRRIQEDLERDEFLHQWIERVQELEREHYRTSVVLAQAIEEHYIYTAGPSAPVESPQEKGTASSTGAEGTEMARKEATEEKTSTSPQEQAMEKDAGQMQCSFHDNEHCALKHIIPVESHSSLNFVSCADASSLGSAKEEDEYYADLAAAAPDDDDDGDSGLFVTLTLASGRKLHYSPLEVRQRCLAFGAKALPLWKTKQRLRQQLQEWTDELQAELADA